MIDDLQPRLLPRHGRQGAAAIRNHDPYTHASIVLTIQPPSFCGDSRPMDREVSFAPRSAEQAVDMRRKRVELARHIAESLAQSLLRAIESRDPINGYSAEEWKEINKSPDNEKL